MPLERYEGVALIRLSIRAFRPDGPEKMFQGFETFAKEKGWEMEILDPPEFRKVKKEE